MKNTCLVFCCLVLFLGLPRVSLGAEQTWWKVQSVDTMKYSRDLARERLDDKSFEKVIDSQVKSIAQSGATHISLGTPYDKQFIPFLKKWVQASRSHGLRIWFRGNFSGWEGWFDYPKITRDQHLALTKEFLANNLELFVDGDIFSPCPECENGGPGDPRAIGDVAGYRDFVIKEYEITQTFFKNKSKAVLTGFFSSNMDVSSLVYDKDTLEKTGGLLVVDHYVASPQKLLTDLAKLHEKTGANIVLGEFGVPIPDIHGDMSEMQQASWLDEFLQGVIQLPFVVGLNYWTNTGGSTELWRANGAETKAVGVIKKYFKPNIISGKIVNDLGVPLEGVHITSGQREYYTDSEGTFALPTFEKSVNVNIYRSGYNKLVTSLGATGEKISLTKEKPSLVYRFRVWLYKQLFSR